jgi:type VI secretion system protein ImpG
VEIDVSAALFPYYERELLFIRQMAQEFAHQFPGPAGKLLLAPDRSVDPHVERLIEAFALIAGRVHHKLDDEFPELTDALLGVLYPHYLAPVPSMAVVQLDLDPERAGLPNGFRVAPHSPLATHPVGGLKCRYRTGYPLVLWPVAVTEAWLRPPPFPAGLQPPPKTRAVLRLQVETTGELPFTGLNLDRLRLFLFGENNVVANLYELLFNHALQVVFRPLDPGTKATPFLAASQEALFPVGFERDEGLLPYPRQSFPGYRLLTEFFTFPSKFQFVDLGGFARARRAGFQRKLEVLIYLDRTQTTLEQNIEAATFRLGCVPVVNLFDKTLEPKAETHTKSEYLLVPDVAYPHGLEVYAVESVASVNPPEKLEYQPFYSFRHGGTRDKARRFWYAARKHATGADDRGTDVYLRLVDLDFDPRSPAEGQLVVQTLCTNRDLPTLLRQAGERLYFELEMAAPVNRVRCLRVPTPTLRPPVRRGAYWRLMSHLSLNHLSLTDAEEGRAALQEILRLYDFSDPESGQQLSAVNEQVIEGVTAVKSRPVVGRTGGPTASGFARGVEVTVEFDESKYFGSGLYLFASVLERFLGLYVTVNSFSQLVATTRQREGVMKRWPPRAGDQPLM